MSVDRIRIRVEAIIIREGLLCVTKEYNQDRKSSWLGFPGGGVEVGQSEIQAAEREALEEVGIAMKRCKLLKTEGYFKKPPMKNSRGNDYDGVVTRFVCGEFSTLDDHLFNSEGDGLSYSWYTPEEARRVFSQGDRFAQLRVQAIDEVFPNLKKKAIYQTWGK